MPVNHIIEFEMDTCVSVKKVGGKFVIDENPNDGNESYVFANIVKESGAKYKVVDPHGPGGGWPIIRYSGTKEQLIPIIVCLDACGRDAEEIEAELEDWDGDEDALFDIIC